MPAIDLAFAFTAGMLATINPCGWAMLPSFVAYYLGTDDTNFATQPTHTRIIEGIRTGVLITLGFLTVFTLMGSIITFGLRFLVRYLPLSSVGIGVLLTLLGVWLLLGGNLPFTFPTFTPEKARSPKAMYLFGLAYGLVSLSCTLPIFLAVVGVSLPQNTWVNVLVTFAVYGSGMAFVLTSLAISLALFKQGIAKRTRHLLPYVHRIGASLLVLAGLYLIWYQGRYLPLILGG
nr:cytochrome c biogenesis protein CcdA [Ardenticatena sp.]